MCNCSWIGIWQVMALVVVVAVVALFVVVAVVVVGHKEFTLPEARPPGIT